MLFRLMCFLAMMISLISVITISFGIDLRVWVQESGIVPASTYSSVSLPANLRSIVFIGGSILTYLSIRGLITGKYDSISNVFTAKHFTRFSGRFLD